MLGIILIILIGRYFYRLAESNQKNGWLSAILGIASYYLGTFAAGIAIGYYNIYSTSAPIDTENTLMLAIIALPFGILAAWICSLIMLQVWKRTKKHSDENILDEDMI